MGMAGLLVKLQGCELNHQMAELAIDVMGEYGMLYEDSPFARDRACGKPIICSTSA